MLIDSIIFQCPLCEKSMLPVKFPMLQRVKKRSRKNFYHVCICKDCGEWTGSITKMVSATGRVSFRCALIGEGDCRALLKSENKN